MKIKSLSAVLLAHRNDTRLLNALSSLSFCNEIVVIDNLSGCNWKQIEKKLQTKITVVEFSKEISNFANAKNTGLQKVKTQWVILLDSDEVLPENTKNEVQSIISQNLYDIVLFQRKDIFYDKEIKFGEAGSTYIPRLFKTKRAQFKRPVHEILESSGKEVQAKNPILHYSHTSVSEFLSKIIKYSKIEADFQKQPNSVLIPQMILYPTLKFVYNFIFKLGFLDGYRGLIYAVLMSLHSFFVRVFQYEKNI